MIQEGILLAFGNPLLDISVNDESCHLLSKYDLKRNNAILAEDKHLPLYDEMVIQYSDKVQYIPGGATLNTVRVIQWILQQPKVTTYFGCISDDKNGAILKKHAEEEGVNVQFQFTHEQPTGTCAVLCVGNDRSLVANLGAANCFKEEFLDQPSNWKLVEKAQFYYSAGFPLTVSPKSMLRLAHHAYACGKTYCLNLSAPFLCSVFKDPMMELLPYVDFLFGNELEADEFSKAHDWNITDRKEITLKMAAWPKKAGTRTVVITQGEGPVLVARGGELTEYPVSRVPENEIVDTNGAGDAFVGGFLAQLIRGKSIDDCVRCGMYCGDYIIRQSGCTLPTKPTFQSES
ncbi:adenosine kinase-like [Pomacea canaliculata]|uniref:adenosine kinase-like n=1 Tax=Pomacea canaliculata TaxID=400727 RepID=UPI000D73C714|nr:adenosine kinase-like [Pomacea canaliculata]